MRRSSFILLFLFTVFLARPAFAARFTGEYLLSVCASDKNGKEITPGGHIACQSYIAGVLDYHNLIHSMGTAPSVDFCVPEGTTLYALQRQVVAYLQKHRQEHEKFVAAPGVALALYELFPCKK